MKYRSPHSFGLAILCLLASACASSSKVKKPDPETSPTPVASASPAPTPVASKTSIINLDPKIARSQGSLFDRIEAVVNRSLILTSDIENFKKTIKLRGQLDPLFTGHPISSHGPNPPKTEIVQFLIDEKIISQAFAVTDAEVEQEITSIQSNNHLDRKGLRAALLEQGYQMDDYFELIRMSMAKRNLIDRDIRTKAFVSEDDITNYFLVYYKKKEGIQSVYHIRILHAGPDALKKVMTALQAGTSFEEEAKRESTDVLAEKGGDLGFLSEKEMDDGIRNQVKKMKVGEVSPVLSSKSGETFLIKLEEIRTGLEDQIKEHRNEIVGRLMSTEYQHQISLWLERERQRIFLHLANQ